jgi:putative ABC transport system ATP-binding protein
VFQRLNDKGLTIVMVTHEADIARCARRSVVMRDGRVIVDSPVEDRLNAGEALRRLSPKEVAGV